MSRLTLLMAASLLATPAMLCAQTPPSSAPAASAPATPVTAMEEPVMGDHWTYDRLFHL
jgi:hypothetical protein